MERAMPKRGERPRRGVWCHGREQREPRNWQDGGDDQAGVAADSPVAPEQVENRHENGRAAEGCEAQVGLGGWDPADVFQAVANDGIRNRCGRRSQVSRPPQCDVGQEDLDESGLRAQASSRLDRRGAGWMASNVPGNLTVSMAAIPTTNPRQATDRDGARTITTDAATTPAQRVAPKPPRRGIVDPATRPRTASAITRRGVKDSGPSRPSIANSAAAATMAAPVRAAREGQTEPPANGPLFTRAGIIA